MCVRACVRVYVCVSLSVKNKMGMRAEGWVCLCACVCERDSVHACVRLSVCIHVYVNVCV